MTLFSVWAPEKPVRLRIAGEDRAMEPGEDGWWHLDVPAASSGADYAFLLPDADDPLPDPRSAW
ncbi:malto-oligosyltrehalose trehalohydrolase, partial [Actinoplanes philippinensis]